VESGGGVALPLTGNAYTIRPKSRQPSPPYLSAFTRMSEFIRTSTRFTNIMLSREPAGLWAPYMMSN
jgi:hypothetical protein